MSSTFYKSNISTAKFLTSKRTVALAGAGLLLLLWSPRGVRAFNPQPDPPAFGLIGVSIFQTARLNAVCADTPLPGGLTPGPCVVTLAFNDASGTEIKRTTQTLRPGQAMSLDLRGADGPRTGNRAEYQPCIEPEGSGFVLATVEVFDNFTGITFA